MAKEAIINKIISDAELKSKEIVSEANNKAETTINVAKNEAESIISQAKKESEQMSKDIVSRQQTVAELDKRKILLNAKQEVIDEVFKKAHEKLINLKEDEYLKIISRLICEYAEDGDEVIKGKDDKYITSEYVSKVSQESKKKISLSKTQGNFKGGIMLSQNGCDKNLTFDALLKLSRNDNEYMISKILFK